MTVVSLISNPKVEKFVHSRQPFCCTVHRLLLPPFGGAQWQVSTLKNEKEKNNKKKKKNAIRKGARGRGSWEEGGKRENHFRPPRALFTLFTVTSSRSYTLKAPPPSSSFVYKPPVGLFFFSSSLFHLSFYSSPSLSSLLPTFLSAHGE